MINKNKILIVQTKFIHISFTKLNLILNKVKGKSYVEALNILKYLPQKATYIIWQTLYSAMSNAVNNYKMDKNLLIISEFYVNKGPILKRMQPRAKGKADEIKKKMSHLTVKLIEKK
jgi:large subunit ribosomal protein L22